MGRMPINNFLMQTVLDILVCYDIGPVSAGKVGMVGYESIALALFSKQVAWSHWCLGDSISARWNGFSIRLPMDDRR